MLTQEQKQLAEQYPPPQETDYDSKDEFEEALAGWRSRVGRLLRPLPDSPKS